MTIREIENALDELQKRHENLDEALLLVLLKAAGWEERAIIDAIAVYRGKHSPKETPSTATNTTKLLPDIQEKPVFIPQVDVDHLLLDHYPNAGNDPMLAPKEGIETPVDDGKEPESLIAATPIPQVRQASVEPPHNLPVKPYEEGSHVWSFARFKSIFFGDSEEVITEVTPDVVMKVTQVPPPVVVQKAPPVAIVASHQATHVIEMKSTPLSRDEYRLVLLASIMLLAILLMLGYMYGHGRL